MNWLKRNMVLVVGGVVALALLGAAGYYLWTQYDKDSGVSATLTSQIDEFTRILNSNPSVRNENIEVAKVEQKRLEALLLENQKFFDCVAGFTNIDSVSFKTLLETTVDQLQKLSDRQGVRTPTKYNYTFKSQRESVVFDPPDLLPWAYQLLEIKALCEAVYDARVHSVLALRRVAMSKKDAGSNEILPARRATTNTVVGAVVTPYEVTFQGFTTELGAVVDRLVRSPICFVVKNINVEPAGTGTTPGAEGSEGGLEMPSPMIPSYTTPATVPTGQGSQMLAQDRLAQRYGLNRGRYGPGRGPGAPGTQPPQTPLVPVPTTPVVRRGPEVIVNEQLLKITMLVDAVRLRPCPTAK